ncbi:hypothetical protein HYS72_00485 [Candidatus Pacearchaeota archaeon]|nr:hypothetical protein [Candidatus Pacearchaeota archaeon]MBI2056732.1 hypothetical protein [Candidatus Pacearchaeota archaeon]
MKKNLIFGMLLVSVLLITSVVSAGITGYVTTRQSLLADSVTATLKQVDRGGTATIVVEDTTTGNVETVRVAEGQTATTSEGTEITASNLRTGGLFRKAGGEISVVTPTVEEETSCKKISIYEGQGIEYWGMDFSLIKASAGSNLEIDGESFNVAEGSYYGLPVGGSMTILGINNQVSPGYILVEFCGKDEQSEEETHIHMINPQQIKRYNPSMAGSQISLGEKVVDANGNVVGTLFNKKVDCVRKDDILIEGGFTINHAGGAAYPYPDSYDILADAPVHDGNGYLVTIFQSASAQTKIASVTVEMVCAQTETAANKISSHFPWIVS